MWRGSCGPVPFRGLLAAEPRLFRVPVDVRLEGYDGADLLAEGSDVLLCRRGTYSDFAPRKVSSSRASTRDSSAPG
ncbi:hypothetical protein GCM10023175_38070 [Pseudonocardia xishanensis]|uniref:Uncharacterized protein n=1 Tax=Pseudonocardia xishanensis TaxID=630995 RepID=A0ABP8RUB4_9PSEU